MKHPLNNLHTAARSVRLSHEEKSLMRERLRQMVEAGAPAAPQRTHTPSPYILFSFSFQRFAMPVAVLLIVALGGTTTYAAQGSLPGGALYPVKIYVNENIQEVLAVSDEAKVSFHTSVAEERLKEAEALASEGKLTTEVSATIEESFNTHVAKADMIAVRLEEKSPASGVDARVTLDSSLSAHSSILATIGEESKDEQTKQNSNSIATRVQSRNQGGAVVALKAAAPASASMQTMAMMAPDPTVVENQDTSATMSAKARVASNTGTATQQSNGDVSQKKVAMQLQKKASAQFETAEDSFGNARRALAASTTAKIKAQLSAIEKMLTSGKKEVKAENYDAARAAFTEVIKASVELNAFIGASKIYKRDFVSTLLWGTTYEQDDDTTHHEVEPKQDSATSTPTPEPQPTTTPVTPSSTPQKGTDTKATTSTKVEGSIKVDIGL